MKQELPIVGIEANDIGRQHIDGEIRRELRNVSAVIQFQPFPAIARHEIITRAFAALPDANTMPILSVLELARWRF